MKIVLGLSLSYCMRHAAFILLNAHILRFNVTLVSSNFNDSINNCGSITAIRTELQSYEVIGG